MNPTNLLFVVSDFGEPQAIYPKFEESLSLRRNITGEDLLILDKGGHMPTPLMQIDPDKNSFAFRTTLDQQ
ncbi:MAG TPA: hypothetical protein VJ417_03980 [Candidatus Glassbacteria bacterium]|nr:hypothetical protein [Candidatus Glassbacteria bacterium]